MKIFWFFVSPIFVLYLYDFASSTFGLSSSVLVLCPQLDIYMITFGTLKSFASINFPLSTTFVFSVSLISKH